MESSESVPLLHPQADVPRRLADVVAEAALTAAFRAGAAVAFHHCQEDLDALLRESLDRSAPAWICERLDELSQQHLEAGDECGEAAEDRLEVVNWLLQRPSRTPVAVSERLPSDTGAILRLVPRPER